LSVISCNIWLSYWSPAPSTTTLPISEPHSKIVCMNKFLDKEQQRQWTWHDMTYLLSSIGHGFLPLQAALSLQEIPIPILGLLDSMDLTRSCPLWWFWHEQLFFTRYSSHTAQPAQHSTAAVVDLELILTKLGNAECYECQKKNRQKEKSEPKAPVQQQNWSVLEKKHESSWIWNWLIPTTTNSDLEKNNKEISGLKNTKGKRLWILRSSIFHIKKKSKERNRVVFFSK
jgi:hypothetical protein